MQFCHLCLKIHLACYTTLNLAKIDPFIHASFIISMNFTVFLCKKVLCICLHNAASHKLDAAISRWLFNGDLSFLFGHDM